MEASSLKDQIEAVLFISPRPLTEARLASLFEVERDAIEEALVILGERYQNGAGGVALLQHGQEIQLVTNPEVAPIVQKFLKEETTGELTKPSLETLTIIAYRGPLPKADLEKIRGVNCSLILRNLMIRGLVEAEEDKRRLMTYYRVTTDFLRFLGFTRVTELPDYDTLHSPEVVERLLEEGSNEMS